MRIERLDGAGALAAVEALADVLMDCVEGGASVGFLWPMERGVATAFWTRVASDVATGSLVLWVAKDESGICGTVQLYPAKMPNQPHRADVAKLQVLRSHRKQGVGAMLMRTLEAAALEMGRWLLVLDTASSEAMRLYDRLGWSVAGVVPDYALMPDGSLCDTTFYWKRLR